MPRGKPAIKAAPVSDLRCHRTAWSMIRGFRTPALSRGAGGTAYLCASARLLLFGVGVRLVGAALVVIMLWAGFIWATADTGVI